MFRPKKRRKGRDENQVFDAYMCRRLITSGLKHFSLLGSSLKSKIWRRWWSSWKFSWCFREIEREPRWRGREWVRLSDLCRMELKDFNDGEYLGKVPLDLCWGILGGKEGLCWKQNLGREGEWGRGPMVEGEGEVEWCWIL